MQNIEPSQPISSEPCPKRSGFAVRFSDGFVALRERLMPTFVKNARAEFRAGGCRGLIKRYGWKIFAAFFCYYLIRDSILYIVLPFLIAKGLF